MRQLGGSRPVTAGGARAKITSLYAALTMIMPSAKRWSGLVSGHRNGDVYRVVRNADHAEPDSPVESRLGARRAGVA